MSGFEVVGVVLAVLPLVVEAVKSYSTVSGQLRTFRHYSRAVKAIQVQFEVQHGIFLNECRLLLRLIEDDRGTKNMLDDFTDARWYDRQRDDRLKGILKDSFSLCRSVIEASKDIVDDLEEELRKFNVLLENRDTGESVKAAIRRLREKARITFEKSKYEKSLSGLRDRNADLSQLRSHVGAFQEQQSCSNRACVARRSLPPRLNAIKTASQKLHEALSDAWCCGDQVHLDLAISCQPSSSSYESRHCEPPIWLYVQSVSIDTQVATKCIPEITEESKATVGVKKKASQELQTRRRKKKRVRWQDHDEDNAIIVYEGQDSEQASFAISSVVAQQTSDHINLSQTQNICHYFKQNLQICGKSFNNHCVGYLETPRMYRHNFYLREERDQIMTSSHGSGGMSTFSILDLMSSPADEALDVVDQLKLAHKAALATLQYNDTPWISQQWRLRDLGYFGNSTSFDEATLKSLHLSSQITPKDQRAPVVMEGIQADTSTISDAEFFGINNMALFSLGIAFLELAHWKPLESFTTQEDANAIITARRLAAKPTPLGPKYQDIARKCLQCNFGFGTDLTKTELQAAVYGDVVSPLEKMIESLSI